MHISFIRKQINISNQLINTYFNTFLRNDSATDGSDSSSKETTYRYLFYIDVGLIVASAIIVICLFNSLRLVVAILETAAEFVEEVGTSLYVPPAMFLAVLIFFAYWLIISLYLYSSGE